VSRSGAFLPPEDVLADTPALSVTGPIEITQTIRTSDLQAALTLIEDIHDDGHARVTIVVSRAARLYSVSSLSREMSLKLASALR
jgi:hypothetical protein